MRNEILNIFKNIKFKIAMDMILNLIGSLIPVAIVQLIVYPQLANHVTAENYGLIQSTVALVYLIGATLGDSLCSARLIKEKEYEKKKLIGDFNVVNAGSILFLVITTPIVLIWNFGIRSAYDIILDCVIVILSYYCSYSFVRFRLEIDYVQLSINHVIGTMGYLVGYGFFLISGTWQCIYIAYYISRLLHLLPKSPLIKEPFKKTELFQELIHTCVGLNVSTFLSKTLSYFDKIILYPILGGHLVSIYITANILGKMVVQITTPFTNVILTYLAKEDSVSKKIWNQILICGGIIGFISYFLCIGVSKSLIYLLYPQWAEETMIYIPVTTASLGFASYAAVLNPFVLKMIDARYQIVISGVSALLYCFLVFIWSKEGLMACCISLLISNIVKVVLTIIIPFFVQRKKGIYERKTYINSSN